MADDGSTKRLLNTSTSSTSSTSSSLSEDDTNIKANIRMEYEKETPLSESNYKVKANEMHSNESKSIHKDNVTASSESHIICIDFENIPKKYAIGVLLAVSIFMVTLLTTIIVVVMYLPQITQQQPCSLPKTIQNPKIHHKQASIATNAQPGLVISPSNVVVEPGSDSLTLTCRFDSEVKCYWMRGGKTIESDSRYQYVTNQPTTDCSITINAVNEIDFAAWQCGNYGNDEYAGITSEEAIISKSTKELKLVKSPKDQTKILGEDVVLECEFSAPVTCEWMRNGNHVTISNRYSFVTGDESEKSDCSIKISGLKTIDYTSWSCGTVSGDNNIFSEKINIYQQVETIVEQLDRSDQLQKSNNEQAPASYSEFKISPKDVGAKSGSTVELTCVFSKDVTCAWLRNGQHVDIQGRYGYTNAGDKSDCSIQIRNLQANDKGGWVCSSMADSYGNGMKSNEVDVSII